MDLTHAPAERCCWAAVYLGNAADRNFPQFSGTKKSCSKCSLLRTASVAAEMKQWCPGGILIKSAVLLYSGWRVASVCVYAVLGQWEQGLVCTRLKDVFYLLPCSWLEQIIWLLLRNTQTWGSSRTVPRVRAVFPLKPCCCGILFQVPWGDVTLRRVIYQKLFIRRQRPVPAKLNHCMDIQGWTIIW